MAGKDTGEEREIWPTERRLQRLRLEGQVPRSRDFQSAMSMLAIVAYLFIAWKTIARSVKDAFALVDPSMPLGFRDEYARVVAGMAQICFDVLVPLFAAGIVGGLLGSMFDAKGFPLQTKSLAPDFARLSPAEGLKKLFSLRSLVELGKGLFVIALVVGANVLLFRTYYNDMFWAPSCGGACVTKVFLYVIGGSVAIGLLVVLIVSFADLPIARWQFLRDNKMSKSELKCEQREEYGDPQIRQERRRQVLQAARTSEHVGLHRAQLLLSFGDAAVALTYIAGRTEAPIVAARTRTGGADFVRRAAEMHLPIMEEPELVALILEGSAVGDFIPGATFNEAARILVQAGIIKSPGN